MTHGDLLYQMDIYEIQSRSADSFDGYTLEKPISALSEVIDLHRPNPNADKFGEVFCSHCLCYYPCKTIKTIKGVLDDA